MQIFEYHVPGQKEGNSL